MDSGNLMPQLFMFTAQLVAGIGQTLCSTLGISYMDDNIKKSKTPALMSDFRIQDIFNSKII